MSSTSQSEANNMQSLPESESWEKPEWKPIFATPELTQNTTSAPQVTAILKRPSIEKKEVEPTENKPAQDTHQQRLEKYEAKKAEIFGKKTPEINYMARAAERAKAMVASGKDPLVFSPSMDKKLKAACLVYHKAALQKRAREQNPNDKVSAKIASNTKTAQVLDKSKSEATEAAPAVVTTSGKVVIPSDSLESTSASTPESQPSTSLKDVGAPVSPITATGSSKSTKLSRPSSTTTAMTTTQSNTTAPCTSKIPCKNGMACKFFARGTCTYLHEGTAPPTIVVTKGQSSWHQVATGLPIEIAPGRHDERDKVIKVIGKSNYLEMEGWPTFEQSEHNIDGTVIRYYARRLALSKLVSFFNVKKLGRPLRILDLCGSLKTMNYVAKVNAKLPLEEHVEVVIHHSKVTAKDLERCCLVGDYAWNPFPSPIYSDSYYKYIDTPLEDLPQYLNRHYFDAVFIQDVQQHIADRNAIAEMVQAGLRVAVAFHVQAGPFGPSGHSGFFIRKENGLIVNYPHLNKHMLPYNDVDDYTWIYETGHESMSWSYNIFYQNVGVAWFHDLKLVDHPDFSPPLPEVFQKKFVYQPTISYYQYVKGFIRERFLIPRFGGDHQEGFSQLLYVHRPTVNKFVVNSIDRAIEKTHFRALLKEVSHSLSAIPWAHFLSELEPEIFYNLLVGTTSEIAEKITELQVQTTSIRRTDAARATAAYEGFLHTRVGLVPIFSYIIGALYFIIPIVLTIVIVLLIVYQHELSWLALIFVLPMFFLVRYVWKESSFRTGLTDYFLKLMNKHVLEYLKEVYTNKCKEPNLGVGSYFVGLVKVPLVDIKLPSAKIVLRDGLTKKDVTCSGPLGNRLIDYNNGINFTSYPDDSLRAVAIGPGTQPMWYLRKSGINMAGPALDMLMETPMTHAQQADGYKSTNYFVQRGEVKEFGIRGLLGFRRAEQSTFTNTDILEWLKTKSDKQKLYDSKLVQLEGEAESFDFSVFPVDSSTNMLKLTEPMLKDKLRNINVAPVEFVVRCGAYTDACYQQLKTEWYANDCIRIEDEEGNACRYLPLIGAGLTPEQVSTQFGHLQVCEGFGAIVAGDDTVYVANIAILVADVRTVYTFYIEGDASSYDRTQGQYPLENVELEAYHHLGLRKEVQEALKQLWRHPTTCTNPEFPSEKIKVNFANCPFRRTGGPDTTFGNTVVNADGWARVSLALKKASANWKDMSKESVQIAVKNVILEVLTSLGQKWKIHFRDNIHLCSFLKGFYLPVMTTESEDGSYLLNMHGCLPSWVPSPAKITRMGFYDYDPLKVPGYSKYKNRPDFEEYCARLRFAEVLNGYKNYLDLPLISDLRKSPAYNGITNDRTSTSHNDYFASYKVSNLDYSYIWQFYGIDPVEDDLTGLQKMLQSHRPGTFVSHPVLTKLSSDYR